MSRAIFKDPEKQQQFDELGYQCIPFLSAEKVVELSNELSRLFEEGEHEQSFFMITDKRDPAFAEKLHHQIKKIVEPELDAHFTGFELHFANCLIKKSSPYSFVPPHQDWTFTDESQFPTMTCWIPLVDVDIETGAMGIIDGSHRFLDYPRASPWSHTTPPIVDHADTLWPYIKPLEMKAGNALVFDNRTIHASFPNNTQKNRLAVNLGIRAKEAALYHFYNLPGEQDDVLLKMDVDKTFFFANTEITLRELHAQEKQPEGGLAAERYLRTTPTLTKEEMEEKVLGVPSNKVQPKTVEALKTLQQLSESSPEPEKVSEQKTAAPSMEPEEEIEWKDPRSFFEIYTPANILAEIKWRLTKSKS